MLGCTWPKAKDQIDIRGFTSVLPAPVIDAEGSNEEVAVDVKVDVTVLTPVEVTVLTPVDVSVLVRVLVVVFVMVVVPPPEFRAM
jgi:hypothetical protein